MTRISGFIMPRFPWIFLLGWAAVAGSTELRSQFSPYLPPAGHTEVTVSHTFVTFDAFWAGSVKLGTQATLGSSGKDQSTTLLTLEHGLTERWALDLTVGTSRVEMGSFPSDEGWVDTQAGLRYLLVDEAESFNRWAPTLALRIGGILAGDYNEGVPFSSGDGASGVEVSLLAGRALGRHFTVLGDLGYRWRNNDVPEDIFGSLGLAASWRSMIFSAAWRYDGAVSGLTILGPGFGTVGGFPQTRERNSTVQLGWGGSVNDRWFLQGYVARTLEGENTGDKRIMGGSVTLSF